MKRVPFKSSGLLTLGVELEFQIINPKTFGLMSRAKDLIRSLKNSYYADIIKPEITQSMIEINSSIHQSPVELHKEFIETKLFLLEQANELNIKICGGGTHPFQRWSMQKIFPNLRFKNLSRQYRYLSKRSTVFGLHIHIGCKSGDDAIYLTHALARYVPQLIALSAASPFYQGVETGYHSARSNIFTAYPLSGVIPYLQNWHEFSNYYHKLKKLGIIKSMKDFYWDIRPKPEFGTVEIRVFDSPLTIDKTILIAAYLQTLSLFILKTKSIEITHDLYYLYSYNRFQAIRYGYDGHFINPSTLEESTILEDLLNTVKQIRPYAESLNNTHFIDKIEELAKSKINDAIVLRNLFKKYDSLSKVVHEQCKLWESG